MLTLGKENGQAQLTNKHRRGAHTDSFKTHGLDYSDFFLLLFAQASGLGGENFAVDGYRTVAALAAHPVTGPLVAKLADIPVRKPKRRFWRHFLLKQNHERLPRQARDKHTEIVEGERISTLLLQVVQLNIAVSSGGVVERVAPMCGWGPAPCEADVQPFGSSSSRRRSEGRFQCQICHDALATEDDPQALETNEMLYVFYRVRKTPFSCADIHLHTDHFAKTGSGPAQANAEKRSSFLQAVRHVEATAERFRVESSELLIFDNWR